MLYYDCCELFDQLKVLLGDDKNILGQYNSTVLRVSCCSLLSAGYLFVSLFFFLDLERLTTTL